MPTAAGIHYFLHEGGRPARPPLVLIHDLGGDHISWPPLVLIHDLGGDHISWPPEIRRMAGMRVFALDLPGHGTSAGPGCQSVPAYAEKVIDFMDAAGISRAAFIGQGLGGAIALNLAIHDPQRVAGTGLISSGARLPIPASVLENAANPATFVLAVQMLVERMHIRVFGTTLKDQVYKRLISNRQTLFHGDLQACSKFNVSASLNVIQSPVLVICGTDDMLTPRRFSETLAGGIPAAALQTIEGAGHQVMLEQPRRVAALLSVFLRTLPYIPGS